MSPIAEFLRQYENIAAPIIEWGGLILLLVIILSPFFIIQHRKFRPIRWWYIIGVYFCSFVILIVIEFLLSLTDQWLIKNAFNSVELYSAYSDATFKHLLYLAASYPLLTFYSTYLLFRKFTIKRFFLTLLTAGVLLGAEAFLMIQLIIYGLGQASYNF